MKAHEIKSAIDDAHAVLIDACDTDDVFWSTMQTGQDSEEAEASGYLAGYRDALAAVQQLVGHHNAGPLRQYVAQEREQMVEQQQRVEDADPGPHFWMVGVEDGVQCCACGREVDGGGAHKGGYGAWCG